MLYQSSEGRLAHATHLQGYAFHICATGDKTVVALFSLAVLSVTNAIFQSLDLMLVLFSSSNGFSILFF